jgi:hypothetical protein
MGAARSSPRQEDLRGVNRDPNGGLLHAAALRA